MAGGITFNFLANVKDFLRGTSSVEDALDEVGDALDDLTREAKRDGIGDALKDDAKEVDSAVDKMEADFTSLAKEVKATGKKMGDELGDGAKRGAKETKTALDDAADEAKSSGKEAAASFSGGFDDVADFLQETIANAFEGFGPIGAAAGIAVAAALGAALAGAQNLQEKLNDAREAGRDLAETLYENNGDLPMQDQVTQLFDTLSKEIRPNGPIQQMIDGFVDFGSAVDGVRDTATRLGVPMERVAKALSGGDMQASRDLLKQVNAELEDAKSRVETSWVWQTAPLEDMKTSLETVIETARIADASVAVVGSAFTSAEYVAKVDAIGQAWEDAATDASDYVTEQDGVASFDWSAYLTDAESTLAAANDYKKKIVTLPSAIQAEGERIFGSQGAKAAQAYVNSYTSASAADKGRFVAAAVANSSAAGSAAGASLATSAEQAAKSRAQGWGALTMPVQAGPVNDSSVRNYRAPTIYVPTVATRNGKAVPW